MGRGILYIRDGLLKSLTPEELGRLLAALNVPPDTRVVPVGPDYFGPLTGNEVFIDPAGFRTRTGDDA